VGRAHDSYSGSVFFYCYHECIKMFLIMLIKYHSITAVFLDVMLPNFATVVHNFRYAFNFYWNSCVIDVVLYLKKLHFDFPI